MYLYSASVGSPESATPLGLQQCELVASTKSVIDPRIDVFAQRALLRLTKGDAPERADAAEMVCAVKRGEIAGIYKEDERVPALRARALGTWWWLLIPKDEDATVIADPTGSSAPILAFRDKIRSIPARLDLALRSAWAAYRSFETSSSRRCDCETCYTPLAGLQPRYRPLLGSLHRSPAPCRAKPDRLEKAECEVRSVVNNHTLIEQGQHYWAFLAESALQGIGGACQEKKLMALEQRGLRLWCELTKFYLRNDWPKTQTDLLRWFAERKRKFTHCVVAELKLAVGKMCFATVGFMEQVLRRKGAFLGTGERKRHASWGTQWHLLRDHNGAVRDSGKRTCIVSYKAENLRKAVATLRQSLDEGYLVRAGVWGATRVADCFWNPKCPPGQSGGLCQPGHYVLIIGHDGNNRFRFWNPTFPDFDDLVYDQRKNQFGNGTYKVVFLQQLWTDKSVVGHSCPRAS